MNVPRVTLIVVQRERFSLTQLSLESILRDQSYPFQLIYVDGGSPPAIAQYLQEQANAHDCMTLIRREHYLRTNEARNLALPLTQTSDYVVFLDNDVMVEPGWLGWLVRCAEEEQAGVVSPLLLQGDPHVPEDLEVHVLGVKADFRLQPSGQRQLDLKPILHCKKLNQIKHAFNRIAVDAVESHAMLIRRSLLDAIVLDETFDSLESHLDICLQADDQGSTRFVEPNARVTFLYPKLVPGINQDELPFYLFKWNEPYIRHALHYAQQKWQLDPHDPTLWNMWKWVISNRQLPAKWAASNHRFYRLYQLLLNSCKLRICPSWLRQFIENAVLKITFPQRGIPLKLNQRSPASAISEKQTTCTGGFSRRLTA
jgi:GT2 family glycosyltransferase